MGNIHSTAIIEDGAVIPASCKIGPYSVIGPKVKLGENVEIMSHVVIDGDTTIGDGTKIFPFSVIGFPPPDKKYMGEDSKLVIGKNNTLREHVTIHTGTAVDRNETTIGDNCLLMANAHVAHDCILGNNIVMANCAALAGHVEVGDGAIIGGLAAVHQYVRIGAYSIVGGMTGLGEDLIPYGRATAVRGKLSGLNLIGLRRQECSKKEIAELNKAFKMLFIDKTDLFEKRLDKISKQFKNDDRVKSIVNFVKEDMSKICQTTD